MPRKYWQDEAACAGMPLEVFYGSIENSLSTAEVDFAKRICQACPVLMDCAVTALKDSEPYGIWAGSSPTDRNRILRSHKGDINNSARYLVTQVLYIDSENNDEQCG